MAQRTKLEVINNETKVADDTAQNEANTAIVKGEGQRKSGSVFGNYRTAVSADAVAKVQLIQDAKQRLAEANDTWEAGNDKAEEAKAIANKAAIRFYQAQAEGTMTKEETSAVLGDVFGFKISPSTGKVSKTPAGRGEEIRKRIVRLVNAAKFVAGEEAEKYFDVVDDEATDRVEAILNSVDNGDRSIWTAYEDIAEIRKEYLDDRLAAWENPKTIMGIVDKLNSAEVDEAGLGVIEKLKANPALAAAYDALGETLETIFASMAEAA